MKDTKAYSPQSSSRLLDLVDTAIFDFLMDNGDRHHYELAQNNFHNPAVLLIDNGKSLGNPDIDHFDILAPLYQCCMCVFIYVLILFIYNKKCNVFIKVLSFLELLTLLSF